MAAGLTLRRDRVEAFRDRLAEVARESLTEADLGPEQRIDLVLSLGDISDDLEKLVRHLEPCGMGNPAPIFGARGVQLDGARRVGSSHLKGTLSDTGARVAAIGFGWADRYPWFAQPELAPPLDVAFRLEQNEWNGATSLQARIVALSEARGPGVGGPGDRGTGDGRTELTISASDSPVSFPESPGTPVPVQGPPSPVP